MHKRKEFHAAPKSLAIRDTRENEQRLAASKKDREAGQRAVDIILVNACLVQPDTRLTRMLAPEGRGPLVQRSKLERSIVVP
jgi:hypothetical protein